MKIFMFVCLLSISVSSIAQVNGYIITVEGNETKGKLFPSVRSSNHLKIKFKDEKGATKIYKPFQIAAWGDGEHHFASKVYEEGKTKYSVFMERLSSKTGELALYGYYVDADPMGYEMLFFEKNQEMVRIKTAKFKKEMASYFSDHEALAEDIEKGIYKNKREDLLKIIQEYNKWRETQWD